MNANTREEIMAAAKAAVQTHGYNALSFRDIAAAVGVKSSSVHYHFPTKGDLATALAERYATQAQEFLDDLQAKSLPHDQLMRAYIAAFRGALEDDNKMCLCGIMAAEYADLPDEVRKEVDRFTTVNHQWLAKVLFARHPKTPTEATEARAIAIFAAIEGAQLVARGKHDIRLFDRIIEAYIVSGLLS
ncbi:TetR/AcrR family transcriptional regulator [Bordetella sp. N]|uniref:TetR/AcrR family transcriptional regulator n=1 Tax=Bordetella sp. N TaxID=1746199 RepID=UPI000709B08A|nr:TetR/AcrR family transcriptional regulator [Bordetella sp. N]ALM82194.1 transcriptional regulator [Bordetella sp. N]